MIERADQLTSPPRVGQTYLVPTVLADWHGRKAIWPVMGPKHDDADLLFPWKHFHIDARFASIRAARYMRRQYDFRSVGAEVSDPIFLAAAGSPVMERKDDGFTLNYPLPEPVWRPRMCHRVEHSYPLPYALRNPPHKALHETFKGRKCAKNAEGLLVCPHKGFVLNSLVPDDLGRVVCPLHGLVIDLQQESVVTA